jgi:hypothetical protein
MTKIEPGLGEVLRMAEDIMAPEEIGGAQQR